MEAKLLEPAQTHNVMVSLYSEEELYHLINSTPRYVPLIAKISE